MYIAFRWLLGMSSTMWITMCCLDLYIKSLDIDPSREPALLVLPNYRLQLKQLNGKTKTLTALNHNENINHSFSHVFVIFFTCSIMLMMIRNNQKILIFARKLYELNINPKMYLNKLGPYLHLKNFQFATSKYFTNIWRNINNLFVAKLEFYLKRHTSTTINNNLNILKRFKELNEERKNLGKLLLTTIRENKNLRIRYQLENLAKTRLTRYIEDADKLMKENRCQFVSFQQLYLATHQENVFLKSRIKKLTKERDDAKRNLIVLVNEICKSKNKDLKTFCCRFIVDTEDSLLNSEVNGDINKFLTDSSISKIMLEKCDNRNVLEHDNDSLEIDNDCVLISQAPKLRGLPGEYVWTIKDKDGLIEQLYQYNCQTDFDNGDTIRRIRQYSVYCDKDCLLDYKSSCAGIDDHTTRNFDNKVKNITYPITKQRFLTGSKAFQRFLRSSGNVMHRQSPIPLKTS